MKGNISRTAKIGKNVFIHESSYIDDNVEIGNGTKIWHFSHILKGAKIGENCSFGQNTMVGSNVIIGNNVKVQNNVSIYEGVEIEDFVFLGPSCVFTNIKNPRAEISRKKVFEKTLLKRGCTIGANATILCGITIGKYAFIAAGTVLTKNVPDYALIMGVPGKQIGWISRHGHLLKNPDENNIMICPESGFKYQLKDNRIICLDLEDNHNLPKQYSFTEKPYKEFKK